MFIIGGNQDVCPRGFICINNYNLLIILIIIVVGIYLLNKQIYLSLYNKMLLKKMNTEEVKSEDIFGVTNPPAFEVSKDGIDKGYGYDEQKHGAMIEYPFNNPTRAFARIGSSLSKAAFPSSSKFILSISSPVTCPKNDPRL